MTISVAATNDDEETESINTRGFDRKLYLLTVSLALGLSAYFYFGENMEAFYQQWGLTSSSRLGGVKASTTANSKHPAVSPTFASLKNTNTSSCLVPRVHNLDNFTKPLPFPVIVVGLPKAGTSSIADFFSKSHHNTTHFYKCFSPLISKNNVSYCGLCIDTAIQQGLPPLQSCGPNTQVWGQLDVTLPRYKLCHVPQMYALDELHAEYPHATWILNFRNVTNWIKSVYHWGNLSKRLFVCNLTDSDSPESLAGMYCHQVERIRSFVAKHPTHALVELDIEDEHAGEYLEKLFHINASYWGHANAGEYKHEGGPFPSPVKTKVPTIG